MGEKRAGIVSIIVPVYNAEQFIRQTINCVQAQTYTNWELLLVDDCSSDKSREYIQEKSSTDQRIKLVSLKKNSGAAEARNRGVKEACGQYICYLDADDIWLPDKLVVEVESLRDIQRIENTNAGFVFMSYEFADVSGEGLGRWYMYLGVSHIDRH